MKYTYRCHRSVSKITEFTSMFEKYNFKYDDKNPEYVFVFGGDGTVLKTVHEFMNKIDDIKLIGINFGRLGFYTDFLEKDFEDLLIKICNNDYDICDLPLIEYNLKTLDTNYTGYALNEVTVISGGKTMVLDTYINNDHFETFRGTGYCISTPSGSTAYNKSLGGAIVDINLPVMQLTEIASINNRVYKTIGSPMILSSNNSLSLRPKKNDKYIISVDNLEPYIESVNELNVKLTNKCVHLLTNKNHSFFDRVKKAFIGDMND